MDASCRCHEMRHEALFSLAQQCERTDLDMRGGRYDSHDRWQMCCTAGYASVERRRAVAIAPLMLASQHDYAWSQCGVLLRVSMGPDSTHSRLCAIVHNKHKLPVDSRSQLSA